MIDPELESVGSAARRGMAWSTASFLGTKVLSVVSLLVLARLLAPSEFGVVAAVLIFLALLELGSDLGMRATIIYEQEQGITERVQTAFTLNLLVVVALTGAALALAPVAAGFFHLEDHVGLFRLGALNILITGLGSIQDALMIRDMRFKSRIVTEIVRAVVRAGVSVGLAFAGLTAAALVWGMVAGSVAWVLAQCCMTRLRPALRIDPAIARSMASYGLATAALAVIAVVAVRLDSAVIGRALGDHALGLYTIGFRIPELVIESVAWNLSLIALPALSRKRIEDRSDLGRSTGVLIRYLSLYAIPAAVLLAVLAGPIVDVLFSSRWSEAAGVMSAIAVMFGIGAVAFPLGDVFKALGRQRVLVYMNIVQIPLLAIAVIALAPYGIESVAWARVGAIALWALLLAVFVARLLDRSVLELARAAGPGLAAGAGVALGAGAVRLAWPALSIEALIAGGAAGLLGGALTLRLLAPGQFQELLRLARSARAAGDSTGV